jgi:alpha-galactosidase
MTVEEVAEVLHTAAETHHVVFAITDGADDDWATWYADWLVNRSRLPDLLGGIPVRSELTYHLVRLDKEYTGAQPQPSDRWEDHYARALIEEFGGRDGP